MELLPDPVKDRQCKTLVPPPHKPLSVSQLYPYQGKTINGWNLVLKRYSYDRCREGKARLEVIKRLFTQRRTHQEGASCQDP